MLFHRWLGLVSGLVVFIVSITGCIYAFEAELRNYFEQDYRKVAPQKSEMIPPSRVINLVKNLDHYEYLHSIAYSGDEDALELIYYHPEPLIYEARYINPYSGVILKRKDLTRDFLYLVLQGHYYLWLPPNVGKPIVAVSTLIFFLMLVLGIYLWWPKHKKALRQRTWFRWTKSTGWKRKNFDLHNIIGFYVSFIAAIIAITGLVWGFAWFAQSYYSVLGGEKSLVYQTPASHEVVEHDYHDNLDILWNELSMKYPKGSFLDLHIPETDSSSIFVLANPESKTHWKSDYLYFDQNTREQLPVSHLWGEYKDADLPDKIMRLNYDIHVGAALGIGGKILAFFASLLCASLPISGILLWYGRKKKSSKKRELKPQLG